MGNTNLHNSKEKWYGKVHFRLQIHNKCLVRRPYPIPKIVDVLQKLEGIRYATSLDLNMDYYTVWLDPDSQKLCTIIKPWGKYQYL